MYLPDIQFCGYSYQPTAPMLAVSSPPLYFTPPAFNPQAHSSSPHQTRFFNQVTSILTFLSFLTEKRICIPSLLTTRMYPMSPYNAYVFNPSLSLNKPHSPLQLPTPTPASIQQFQFQKVYKGYIASVPRPQRPHPRVAKQQVSAPPRPKPIKRKKQSRAEKCTHRPPNEPSAERGKRVAACEYVCVW